MTRTNAREIAVHLTFELSFTNQTADELLDTALTRATFALIGEEEPLYAEYPNAKQREYISELVRGVYLHCPEPVSYTHLYPTENVVCPVLADWLQEGFPDVRVLLSHRHHEVFSYC